MAQVRLDDLAEPVLLAREPQRQERHVGYGRCGGSGDGQCRKQ